MLFVNRVSCMGLLRILTCLVLFCFLILVNSGSEDCYRKMVLALTATSAFMDCSGRLEWEKLLCYQYYLEKRDPQYCYLQGGRSG